MRILFLIVFSLLIANLNLYSQGLLMDYIDPQYQNTMLLYHQKYDKVDGNPYFVDDFTQSKVVLTNLKLIDTLLVKLDLFENSIIFLSGKRELVMNQQFIKSVSVYNSSTNHYHSFKYLKLGDGRALAEIIMESKSGGLYKVYKRKIVKPSNEAGYGAEASERKSYLTNKDITVLVINDKLFELTKLSNKAVATCFPNPDQMAEYIDQKGLNCKNEADIKLLISYYDQLN